MRSSAVSILRRASVRKKPADDAHPLRAEEHEQGQGGRYMQADEEREVERLVGRLAGDQRCQPSHAGTSTE